jgi:hypothetical protein
MATQNHFVLLLLLAIPFFSYSQSDSSFQSTSGSYLLDTTLTKIDTIVVNREPYIIHNYIYISKPKKKIKRSTNIKVGQHIAYFAGPVFYKNRYCNCPEYGDYLSILRKNTKNLTSYEIGLNYQLSLNSIVTEIAIKFSSLMEQYSFFGNSYTILPTGPVYDTYTYKNTYNYLSLEAGIGYVYKLNKVGLSFTGRGSLDHLTHANAVTLDPGMNSVTNVNSLGILSNDVYYLGAASKLSYDLTGKIALMLEPYYRLSMNSITHTDKIFPVSRTSFSLRAGVIHTL